MLTGCGLSDASIPFECKGPPVAEELPTEEELRALPRRAIVAYAARCARYVQPLYRSKDERHVQAVEDAIALAERFAKGEPPRAGEASEAILAMVLADSYAAYAARAAAKAVYAADADAEAARAGANAARAAAFAGGPAADAARRLLVISARADYERLRSICPQGFGELGEPIDPGENGPLGPLCPIGPLEEWPAGLVAIDAGLDAGFIASGGLTSRDFAPEGKAIESEGKGIHAAADVQRAQAEKTFAEVEGELARLANEARPAGLVSVYFDDRGFSARERLLVLKYLAEVYRDRGGTGLKVAGGSTLVPSREEVAP